MEVDLTVPDVPRMWLRNQQVRVKEEVTPVSGDMGFVLVMAASGDLTTPH